MRMGTVLPATAVWEPWNGIWMCVEWDWGVEWDWSGLELRCLPMPLHSQHAELG